MKFNEKQTALRKKIEETVLKSGYTPVKKAEFYSLDQEAEGVVEALCGSSFVQLTPEYVISGEYFNKAVQAIHDYIREHGRMALGDFRDITDSSRKSSMLILEYADSLDITRRVENYRVLGSYWNRQQ
ncbi:SelB C-terminal domain-containing protein [Anaeroglobus geminatus]|uniref:SelB domain-containing protein n=1 Tax=Anaeroglobus geminatus TaxID=156456 RepID=UPI001FE1FB6D|nr:SelB C-terminal domain-containing protein [Anaeroglobus geminatus]